MTVKIFCLTKAQPNELIAIKDKNNVIATVWIDSEDIFKLPEKLRNKEVKNDEWGSIVIASDSGDLVETPCHYVNI